MQLHNTVLIVHCYFEHTCWVFFVCFFFGLTLKILDHNVILTSACSLKCRPTHMKIRLLVWPILFLTSLFTKIWIAYWTSVPLLSFNSLFCRSLVVYVAQNLVFNVHLSRTVLWLQQQNLNQLRSSFIPNSNYTNPLFFLIFSPI